MITNARKSIIDIRREDLPITDREIISRYLGIQTIPCTMCSPLRDDDDRPSFSLIERGGSVIWKDFGLGEGGDTIKLMSLLWQVEYREAMLRIKLDTDSKLPKASLLRRYKGKVHLTVGSTLQVTTRPWRDWDIDFWKSFGISKDFAVWCNVYPVSHALFTKEVDGEKVTIKVPMDKYAYAYFEWKDNKESIKLYQPFSDRMKWLSKHDASVWDLWKHAMRFADYNYAPAVIITSSRKDAMCLWENLKVPAMSLQGEGYLPKPQVMAQVFDKFECVYLWYDNDFKHKNSNPGQDNAKKLIELYPKLKNICIPDIYQCKDPSDLYKKYGKVAIKKIWKEQQ